MHLVILAGGTGKRLEPLTSEDNPKQLIKVLDSPSGEKESMLERTIRMLADAGLPGDDGSLSVITNNNQAESVKSQIGDNAEIILEPDSRNTYPAVLLASSYLIDKKGVGIDDSIVILPVDTYANDDFYKLVGQMDKAVKEHSNSIILIGTKAFIVSEDFGYIVPDKRHDDHADAVLITEFKEKPGTEKALGLIMNGALWNCGVFGFSAGFIKNYMEDNEIPTLFDDLAAGFTTLPKINFDREVVEKADEVRTLLYEGEWRDLGTKEALDSIINP